MPDIRAHVVAAATTSPRWRTREWCSLPAAAGFVHPGQRQACRFIGASLSTTKENLMKKSKLSIRRETLRNLSDLRAATGGGLGATILPPCHLNLKTIILCPTTTLTGGSAIDACESALQCGSAICGSFACGSFAC
jgi:hypothetical protein